MLQKIKSRLTNNLINIPGWHTNRKILVIESDDWGSIRMPSKEVYQLFLDKGIRVDKDPYCKYDSLATKDDLTALFDVLSSVKDKNGQNAIITANTIVTNPNFEKILASSFNEYFYETFTDTLKRSPEYNGAFELWKEGISAGIFRPQFHGREHLNVKKWLRILKSGENVTRTAFDLGTFGLTSAVDSKILRNYMGAFNSGLDQDIDYYKIVLREGLDIFENLFGYRSESFIATTYTWHPKIEFCLQEYGVRFLQGMIHQKIPIDDDKTFIFKKNNYLGTYSKSGLIYLMRNCFFEPSQNNSNDIVDQCMKRIKIAFYWRSPATISMHRLNFIGNIDKNNRIRSLELLKQLLIKIVKLYPDVEFMSSDQLGNYIVSNK